MQGAGNDYIYLNGFEKLPADLSALSRRMSDRHFGIGADGIVVIMPSDHCDFRMRMFNADGTEAEMCGNASRCIGKYVYDKGLTSKTQLTLETLAGIKHLILDVKNGTQALVGEFFSPSSIVFLVIGGEGTTFKLVKFSNKYFIG